MGYFDDYLAPLWGLDDPVFDAYDRYSGVKIDGKFRSSAALSRR